jgi:hypothetical protein
MWPSTELTHTFGDNCRLHAGRGGCKTRGAGKQGGSGLCQLLKFTEAGMWASTELTHTFGANCCGRIGEGGGSSRKGVCVGGGGEGGSVRIVPAAQVH